MCFNTLQPFDESSTTAQVNVIIKLDRDADEFDKLFTDATFSKITGIEPNPVKRSAEGRFSVSIGC